MSLSCCQIKVACLAKVLNVVPHFSLSSYGTESAGNPSVFQAIDAQIDGVNVNGELLLHSHCSHGRKGDCGEEISILDPQNRGKHPSQKTILVPL